MKSSKITNIRKKLIRKKKTVEEPKELQKRNYEDTPPKPSKSPGKAWDYAMEEWFGDVW